MWDKFVEIENAFWWILFLVAVIGSSISWIVTKSKEFKRQMEYEKSIPDDDPSRIYSYECIIRKTDGSHVVYYGNTKDEISEQIKSDGYDIIPTETLFRKLR